jgi:hypothetical protein
MGAQNNNSLVTNTSVSSGSYLTLNSGSSGTSGSLYWSNQEKTTEFIEFALEIMGVSLKYSDFVNMSDADKTAFIRDLKIKKILD